MLLSAIVVSALAWYIMTPAERGRALAACSQRLASLWPSTRSLLGFFRRERSEALEEALRQRASWPLVTMGIATANVAIHAWSHLDPATPVAQMLVSVGPKTTNGEWWRLITTTFVHSNVFELLVNTLAVVQVGMVLERLVGSLTFGAVYSVAAVFASLYAVSGSGFGPTLGASGAVSGIYGLLLATWMWGALQHADSTLRLGTVKAFAPVAALFSLVALASGALPAEAEYLGLATGFTCGVLTARPVRLAMPPVRRVATIAAAGAYLAIVAAVPLRGMTDPRPTLATAAEVEERTTAAYDAALKDFRHGRLDKIGLAKVIDGQILPPLRSLRLELQVLGRAPRELKPLVGTAEIYALRRIESWKIRADALRSGNSRGLRDAETVERAALERLRAIPRQF